MKGVPLQPEGLVRVLLDATAELSDRHDAAMDLSAYDEPKAEQALARIACDMAEDHDLADACGESLAEIWSRQARLDDDVVGKLSPAALAIALGTLEALAPNLCIRARAMLDGGPLPG
jgi:hypothetical protein